MKTATLFLLISALSLQGATVSFSNITSTNAAKTNDLLLLDAALGGTNYATRTITAANFAATALTNLATQAQVATKQLGSANLTNVAAGGGSAANWVASGTTNSTLAGTASLDVLTVTNQMGFVGVATASLPTGVAVGYQTYCTDCLTPWGAGDRVEWDGSNWKTLRARVVATATPKTYMQNLAAVMWSGTTVKQISRVADCLGNASSLDGWYKEVPSGSGAGVTASGVANRGSVLLGTGTTTTGFDSVFSMFWFPQAGDMVFLLADINPVTACDGTDTYWLQYGTSNNQVAMGAEGNFFLYDLYNTQSHGSAATNNWLCISRVSSVNTLADSGVAVQANTYTRLGLFLTSTNTVFYINGVSVATNTTVSSTVQYLGKTHITKTAGSNSRQAACDWAQIHVRYASDRATFP